MRYIVLEYNERDPYQPLVKVFSGTGALSRANLYDDQSPNTCEIYRADSNLSMVHVPKPEPTKEKISEDADRIPDHQTKN